MSYPWTCFDFIVNGEFADAAHLKQLVGRVREAAKADCAILLVQHEPEFFQSLMYVRCRPEVSVHEEQIQNSLIKVRLEAELDELEAMTDLLENRRSFEKLRDLLGWPLVSNLFVDTCRLYGNALSRVLVADIAPRRPTQAANPVPVVGVLCIGCPEDPAPAAMEQVNELAIAVCASAPVYLHRLHSSQMRQMQNLYRAEREFEARYESLITSPAAGEPSPYEWVLKEILTETGSDQGGVFIIGGNPNELEAKLRMRRGEHGDQVLHESPPIVLSGPRRSPMVAKVFRKAQAMLVNGRNEFLAMNPRVELRPFPGHSGERANAFLTVPIVVRGHQNERGASIGVLNVEKGLWSETGGYTLHDYWYMLEGGRLMSKAWKYVIQHALLGAVRDQQKRLHATPSMATYRGLARTKRMRSAEDAPKTADPSFTVPEDLELVRNDIQDLVSVLFKHDELISACTVRVLSVDQTHLVLLAHCSSPSDEDPQPFKYALALSGGGGNGIVQAVRTGQEVHGNSEPGHRAKYLVCIPVLLATRCVGAVTFGTRFHNNFFDNHFLAMRAVADAVCETFEFAQICALGQILHPTTQVLAGQHELQSMSRDGLARVEALRKLAGGFARDNNPEARRMLSELDKLKSDFDVLLDHLTATRNDQPPDPNRGEVSLQEMVDALLNANNLAKLVEVHVEHDAGRYRLDMDHLQFCHLAISDLLKNAANISSGRGYGHFIIRLSQGRIGGKHYGYVTISNQVHRSDRLPDHLIGVLYRVPFRRETNDRLHCGAFHAGWLMRAIGGDVRFVQMQNDLLEIWHHVTVEIPIPGSEQPRPS